MKWNQPCFILFVAAGLFLFACGGDSTDPCNMCAATATCSDDQCVCNEGYEGDGVTCTDIDECATDNGGCDENATCTNEPGSHSCACNTGFEGDGAACTDIDECVTDNGGCDLNATCANEIGSRICTCDESYYGDGETCMPYWTEVVSLPGVFLSTFFYTAAVNDRIYFAGSSDPVIFKSLDPVTLNIRDETLMVDARDDFSDVTRAVEMVGTIWQTDKPTIHAIGKWAQMYQCTNFLHWSSLIYPDEFQRGEAGLAFRHPNIYIVGGRNDDTSYNDSLTRLNVETGEFTALPSYPVGVNWPAAALIGGLLYVTGGAVEGGNPNTLLAAYSLRGGSWTLLDSAPFGGNTYRSHGVAFRNQFWVWNYGGEFWIYDPATSAWLPDPIPRPQGAWRYRPVLLNDELYMVGTAGSPDELTQIVRYTGP
jgi:hypothetical protein